MVVLFLGFILSAVVTFFVIRSARAHAHFSADADMSGPQKFHATPVPRIGGVGIVIGLVASLGLLWLLRGREMLPGVMLLICAAPAFLGGLAEDLTKSQSPRRRLFFVAVSAALAAWAMGSLITRTDIPGVDWLVSFSAGAVLLTIFAVAGVANAVNIIDGFNGLAAMCVVMMLGSIAYVAFQTQDPVIALCALAGLGAVMGFFVWNFPAGLIFLGDGGAYFLGFYVAELSILLLQRNPDVSPLCPLLMCIYPIFETVFSMYRRRFVRGRPMGMPDGVHLHSLIYRRLMRWAVGNRTAKVLTKRNSMTAPYLWLLCMMSVVPAMIFWSNSLALGGFVILFGATYMFLYARIVRFKAPDWLIVRR
ncbi:glycosyltransferase [Piscinibacter sp. XHJ-5]|uniref:MraY family glycosyltransferase n=1 Tax=Piscinibacter sp. XHJ-5 TaxID=3037797 RepID=UPI00245303E8|nr:glycosyltransferase [Piscinibacter sp. XHJ-5]